MRSELKRTATAVSRTVTVELETVVVRGIGSVWLDGRLRFACLPVARAAARCSLCSLALTLLSHRRKPVPTGAMGPGFRRYDM